ncbi:MAG: helix-turn-helix transcriptional regulator [Bacteroidales bacterium]|nr:helix-turn-helix transcriptional regulator [Bacteroidales bacterium]
MNRILNRKLLVQEFMDMDTSPELQLRLSIALAYSETENAIAVLSDLKEKVSHIFYGGLGDTLGIASRGTYRRLHTIWEEEILCRIPEEDMERKQLEELHFFEFIHNGASAEEYYMQNTLAMKDSEGAAKDILHRIFYFRTGNAIRFALCLYTPAQSGTVSAIVHSPSGKLVPIATGSSSGILSSREKQILSMIDSGMSSKEISARLSISLNTVSRHRQNILSKLHATNSSHACRIGKALRLI